MKKIYFKVVRVIDGKRVSAWVSGKASLSYPVLATVEADPMSAGIFLFKTRKAAKAFAKRPAMEDYKTRIIRCYGHGPAKHFKHIVCAYRTRVADWLYQKSWGPETPMQDVPPGTIAFMKITTLE